MRECRSKHDYGRKMKSEMNYVCLTENGRERLSESVGGRGRQGVSEGES